MIGECTKQLTNAIAVPRTVDMAGGTVRGGDTQRYAGVGKVHELGVFAEAREHTASRVGHDELECAGAGTVGDQPAVGPAAMFEDVVLQLAQCTHQACYQALGQAPSNRRVLRVRGPLIPEQVFGPVVGWIEPTQREHTRSIVGACAADRLVYECTFDLMENRRFDRYATIRVRHRHASNGELHQWADKTRSTNGQRRHQRQPSGNGLPEQVVRCLERRRDAAVPTLRQRHLGVSRPVRLMSRLPQAHSDRTSETPSLHATAVAATPNSTPDRSVSPSRLLPRPIHPSGIAPLPIPDRPTVPSRRHLARWTFVAPSHIAQGPVRMKSTATAHPATRYNER